MTFVYTDPDETHLVGDIVLCAPVVEREANADGKPLHAHYAHLSVHGVLHLQGYAHEHDAESQIMQARETTLLKQFGFDDPYALP